jgi:hypothetical protein
VIIFKSKESPVEAIYKHFYFTQVLHASEQIVTTL